VKKDFGEQAAKWLRRQDKKMETALAELVRINSFTGNVEGGKEVGQMLAGLFTVDGFSPTCVPSKSGKYADHLVVASTWKSESKSPIALVGHLDTVFPPGTFEGFRRDGDLARGPGVLDMKGGLVVVAWALRALAEVGASTVLPPVKVVVVSDEEIGSPEGRKVIAKAIRGATGALVFEAGRKGDAIITRRKGTGAITLVATGKAAHAGNAHQEGVNAIWALAKVIDRLQGLTDYSRGLTVNVGKVVGGTTKNTVPDHAEAYCDLRFERRADAEGLMTELRRAAAEVSLAVPGSMVEVRGGVGRMPLEKTAASARLMDAYGRHALASGLGAGDAGLIGGGSDASTAAEMGIAAIDGLGPRGIGFHTPDEQIEVATLVLKAQALARFLASLGQSSRRRGRVLG
jgi:glutamate carboxypeptidase